MRERDDQGVFERTEELLYAVGREKAQMARALGLPRSSGIAAMIAKQRVFEAKQAGRAGPPRKRRRFRGKLFGVQRVEGATVRKCYECRLVFSGDACPRCSTVDAKQAATELRTAPAPDVSHARDTRSMAEAKVGLSSRAATVTQAINALPYDWMREAIYLAYFDEQPDRICARIAQCEREDFTRRRRAAVATVAEILAGRYEASVYSASPTHR